MFCPQCGTPILDRAKFCRLCSARLGEGGVALASVETGSLSLASGVQRPESTVSGQSSDAAFGGNITSAAAAPGLAARVRNVLARVTSATR
jgi:hypothetical protein